MTPAESPFAVDVQRLHYRFPGGQTALCDVSFRVAAGERVAIVGPSGAGKSTLLLHLNGLLPETPHKGSGAAAPHAVRIGGVGVARETLADVRRRVGLLFQDPDDQLFCPTVREDVAFGPLNLGLAQAEILHRIDESLEAVGLGRAFGDRNTLQLSVGERKRVALAGVLACGPEILVLDEPSANLDPRSRRTLLTVLEQFAGSQVIATHDLDLVVAHCHRVVLLDGGRVFADGPPHDVLADAVLMDRHGLEVPCRLELERLKDAAVSLAARLV